MRVEQIEAGEIAAAGHQHRAGEVAVTLPLAELLLTIVRPFELAVLPVANAIAMAAPASASRCGK